MAQGELRRRRGGGVCGDVGQGDDLEAVRQKALATGASKCIVEDLRARVRPRLRASRRCSAGAVYEDRYLLGTSLARPLIAYRQVQAAIREGADALSHGCTGKGNDQVRFEVTYAASRRSCSVIAPWREWTIRSREDALAYAPRTASPSTRRKRDLFSRDGNLWHLSHEGGNLEDAVGRAAEGHVQADRGPARRAGQAATSSRSASSTACRSRSTASGSRRCALVETLNQIAGAHGVGRVDLVENRLVGMKSRGVYETPAGTVLHVAHRELERLVLDRDTLHFKQSVSVRYAAADLRRPVVLDRCARRSRPSSTRPSRRSPARCACGSTRAAPRPSAAARRAASTARTSPPSARAWPTTTRTPRASSACSGCPSACARSRAAASPWTSRRSR